MPQHSNHRSPRRRQKDHEKILEEIIVENFPKMGKEIVTQVQETQRVPNRINPRRHTPRHILIKLTKIKHKEQILKAAREKQKITHKRIPIRITVDLLGRPRGMEWGGRREEGSGWGTHVYLWRIHFDIWQN